MRIGYRAIIFVIGFSAVCGMFMILLFIYIGLVVHGGMTLYKFNIFISSFELFIAMVGFFATIYIFYRYYKDELFT